MLELTDVTKRFGETVAVRGVSLRVGGGGDGEGKGAGRGATALIGPSGCGKSTLLRLMIGFLEPSEGAVRFDGEALTRRGWRAARRRMGYAIQSGGLFPHLTARRNVELPARYWGMGRSERGARIEELAGLTHLPMDALDRYPSELSGGQRQRVALMRALVLDPEVLLLDEPLGALDPIIRSELQGELREIIGSLGKTVVLVTHDLAEAAYLCGGDIVLLRDGAVAQRGSFETLVKEPADAFVSRFIRAQAERVKALAGVVS